MTRVTVRFYQELNRFLVRERRKRDIVVELIGSPSLKDFIESLGVPHTEVDLVLVNGESVAFHYNVQDGDRISVYPMFESFAVAALSRVRQEPLRDTRFVLDVHLGKLARILRMLGFDTVYRNDLSDPQIVDIAAAEGRIVLTRDQGLLMRRAVTRGYYVRSQVPLQQAVEVLWRFDLRDRIQPLRRCIACNGIIEPASRRQIADRLLPATRANFNEFFRCTACGKLYWKGSHYEAMIRRIQKLSGESPTA